MDLSKKLLHCLESQQREDLVVLIRHCKEQKAVQPLTDTARTEVRERPEAVLPLLHDPLLTAECKAVKPRRSTVGWVTNSKQLCHLLFHCLPAPHCVRQFPSAPLASINDGQAINSFHKLFRQLGAKQSDLPQRCGFVDRSWRICVKLLQFVQLCHSVRSRKIGRAHV